MFNFTPIVRNLLIVNVFLYLIAEILRINFGHIFGLYYINSPGHEFVYQPYTLFTYMFLHGSFNHLLSNMFGLLIFGSLLEHTWGPKRFLFYYLVTGIGAGVIYSIWLYLELYPLQVGVETFLSKPNYLSFLEFVNRFDAHFYLDNNEFVKQFKAQPNAPQFIAETTAYAQKLFDVTASVPMVGASGAIFGLIIAFGYLFPDREMYLFLIPFPIKAKYFVALYGVMEVYSGLIILPGDNVAHFAHLGGMLVGFLLLKYWERYRTKLY